MLTESRIKKILGLVKKEYDYMDNKPIHIIDRYDWSRCWCVAPHHYNYIIRISKNFGDYIFLQFHHT